MDKQEFQEEYYQFPYHYVPKYKNGNFIYYYSGNWFIEYISFLEFLLEYLEKKEFHSIIEVGCGDGRIISEVYRKFKNKKIKGIDISNKAIFFAKAFNYEILEIFEAKNIEKCNQKYDIILLIEVFEHIPLDIRDSFLKSLKKIMHKDSFLIMTVPHKNRQMDIRHYEHFTLASLKSYFSDFELIESKFIARKHKIVGWIYKILENDLFILKKQSILNYFYKLYKNNFLFTDKEKEALRIFGVFKLK